MQIYGYYLLAVKTYYLIKHYTNIDNLPYDLKQLLAKNKTTDLGKKLDHIDKSISLKYKYYKKTAKPSVVSNFLLYSLSTSILTMYKNMKSAGINVSTELTKYIIDRILNSDKMLSKPDLTKFKASAIVANEIDELDTMIESDVDGDNIRDGYVSPAESEKSLLDMSDDDPDNEFAIGDLDIETGFDDDENTQNNPMDF